MDFLSWPNSRLHPHDEIQAKLNITGRLYELYIWNDPSLSFISDMSDRNQAWSYGNITESVIVGNITESVIVIIFRFSLGLGREV